MYCTGYPSTNPNCTLSTHSRRFSMDPFKIAFFVYRLCLWPIFISGGLSTFYHTYTHWDRLLPLEKPMLLCISIFLVLCPPLEFILDRMHVREKWHQMRASTLGRPTEIEQKEAHVADAFRTKRAYRIIAMVLAVLALLAWLSVMVAPLLSILLRT